MNIEESIASYAVMILGICCVALLLLAIISLKVKPLGKSLKKILFGGIVAAVLLPTLFLIFSTIYVNLISESKGPVHWHADIEVWACGEELDFKDPTGFSNKIGSATFHEHNDKRIHVEGVVIESRDVSLSSFFNVIGGVLTPDTLMIPTVKGMEKYQNGQTCPSGESGQIQIFVYKTEGTAYYQEKVTDPASYIMAGQSAVPPGDCVIVEFGEEKEKTDRLCQSYEVAKEIGKLEGERK